MQWKRVERRPAASAVRSTLGKARLAGRPGASRRFSGQAADVHRLESRTLCSVSLSFETLVNASKNPFN